MDKESLDWIPEIIWVIRLNPPDSHNFVFELLNRTYEQEVGIKHDDVVGKTPYECFAIAAATEICGHHAECAKQRRRIIYSENLDIGGEQRWWRTKLNPVFNEKQQVERIIGTAEQIDPLESKLRNAIRDGDLSVFFQPIVRLKSVCIDAPCSLGCLAGYEALIRWPDSGYSPADFLPVATSAGLMPNITRLVLFRAIAQLATLPPDLFIAVNVADCEFEADLDLALEAYQTVRREQIPFEITEHTKLTSNTIRRFIRLQELGHKVEFDDFGTEKANLAWLQNLRPNALKLDCTFVRDVHLDPNKQRICRAAIDLAKQYDDPGLSGIAIVAEGVETLEEMQWLEAQGVEYAQGYLFSKPLAPSEMPCRLVDTPKTGDTP